MDVRSERDAVVRAVRPSVAYDRAVGTILVLLGAAGILGADSLQTAAVLGIELNDTHGAVLVITGSATLAASWLTEPVARMWTIVFGAAYLALGLWGMVAGHPFDPFGAFGNVNAAGSWLHLAVGISALVVAAVSVSTHAPD